MEAYNDEGDFDTVDELLLAAFFSAYWGDPEPLAEESRDHRGLPAALVQPRFWPGQRGSFMSRRSLGCNAPNIVPCERGSNSGPDSKAVLSRP